MASTNVNVKFPDGRTKTTELITAYKAPNGVEYRIFNTGTFNEDHYKIAGVSFKPVGEERFQKPLKKEEWDESKRKMVDDIHGRTDSFGYIVSQEEILVTEDYAQGIALRDENYYKLKENYEKYLKTQQTTVEAAPEINPFVAQEPVSPQVTEEPQPIISEISPAPIVDTITAEAPSIAQNPEMVQSAPIENNVVEFPNVENTNLVQKQNTAVDTPVVEENNEKTDNSQNSSISVQYYEEKMNALIQQLDDTIKNFNDVSQIIEKMRNAMVEIGGASINILKEVDARDNMSVENFNKSQQILAEQNEDMARDLTKVA